MEELIPKLVAESPLAAAIVVAVYVLRPVLKMYLDQQIAQLKLMAETLAALTERLDRVERKVDEIADATDAHGH